MLGEKPRIDMDWLKEIEWEEGERLEDWAGSIRIAMPIKLWRWWGTLPEGHTAPTYGAKTYVGVDAGRYFGLATIRHNMVWLYSGELPQLPGGASEQAGLAFDFTLEWIGPKNTVSVLEGAAYGSTFGEANLAYIRMGFGLALRRTGPIKVVAPAKVRKAVTGHGDKRVGTIWGVGQHSRKAHALDALGCALYAAGLTMEQDEDGD
jgi:hypothetical protein